MVRDGGFCYRNSKLGQVTFLNNSLCQAKTPPAVTFNLFKRKTVISDSDIYLFKT